VTVEQLVSVLDIIHALFSPSVLSFLIPVFFPFYFSPFSPNKSNCMNNSNGTQKALKSSHGIFNNICCLFFSPSFWFFYAVQLENCMSDGEHPFSTGTMTHSYCALIGIEQGRTI